MAKNISKDELKQEKEVKELLKKRLDEAGISYHPNSGIVTLEEKVKELEESKSKPNKLVGKKVSDKDVMMMKAKSLVKVNISSMHKDEPNAQAAYASCINQFLTLSKMVPLGVDIALEEALVRFFEEKKMMVPVPDKDAGPGNYKYEERPWYNVKRY
jgi:hypothetical protein